MAVNDFLPFGTGDGVSPPNVLSQAQWAALAQRISGWQSGKASSAGANKVFRQGSVMAAALGQIVLSAGLDALDNGDVPGLAYNIRLALQFAIGRQRVRYINAPGTYNIGQDEGIIAVDNAAGPVTVVLPKVSNYAGAAHRLIVYKLDGTGYTTTVRAAAGDNINGVAQQSANASAPMLDLIHVAGANWLNLCLPEANERARVDADLYGAIAREATDRNNQDIAINNALNQEAQWRIQNDNALSNAIQQRVEKNSAFSQLGANAFVQGDRRGVMILPNGFYLQWGEGNSGADGRSGNLFYTSFPTRPLGVLLGESDFSGWYGAATLQPTWHGAYLLDNHGFQSLAVRLFSNSGGATGGQAGIGYYWLAWGY